MGRDLYYILVFLQTVSQKVGREGQLIILGWGRSGNNTLNPEKCVLCYRLQPACSYPEPKQLNPKGK